MCMSGGDPGAAARKLQKEQQASIEAATGQINNAFSGFTPQFYKDKMQAYENFAEPQLMQQYGDTAKQLTGKLANQGLLNSSAALSERGALTGELNRQQQGVANQALSQSQQLQQQVADQKQRLIAQANAASNPQSVAQGALGAAAQFQAPSAFAPLGQLFQGFGNMYLGSQLASTYNPALSSYYLGGGAPKVSSLGGSFS